MARFRLGLVAMAIGGCTTMIEPAPAPSPPPAASPAAAPSAPPAAASPSPTAAPTVKPLPTDLPPAQPAPAVFVERRVIGVFPSYAIYDERHPVFVADLPGDAITHLVYGPARVTDEGLAEWGDAYADAERRFDDDPEGAGEPGHPRGNFGQLERFKRSHRAVQVLITLGGWSGSKGLATAARTDESRRRFVSTVISRFLDDAGDAFDGVELDWQWPVAGGQPGFGAPEDRANHAALIAELRRQLDARGKADGRRFLLAATLPGGTYLARNFDLDAVAPLVDWFHVRSTDYHGPGWEDRTNFAAPLFGDGASVDQTMRGWLATRVLPSKLVMGVSTYGRGWRNVPATNDGLYQQAIEPWRPEGTRDTDPDQPSGNFTYEDVATRLLPAAKRGWSAIHQVPWLYLPARGWFVTYEDGESVDAKVGYVRQRNLGGVALTDLTGDGAGFELTRRAAKALAASPVPSASPSPAP